MPDVAVPRPPQRPRRSRRRTWGYAAAWIVAATLAVSVGVIAVSSVGDSLRGRGPIGQNELIRTAELNEGAASIDPGSPRASRTFSGEYGEFVVECRGALALGVEARPARGWRTVSYEPGPDDDVDAVFSRGGLSVELEVFCNQGAPTIAELERKTLPDD
ncbi:MAG: hypothetical protein F2667_13230 [Actinobacteria bacterium]|uniref:Unannotated protein n=1 Tax=freshwater metagenome TaxID=449393 RepID=A0A6J6S5S2_9ZZZZ|nr:hypothetical protein [Actinomycetota bacterium]